MKKYPLVTIIISLLVLISAHVFLSIDPIKKLAPTYDEPVHLTAGYIYWKTGDYRYNGYHHPPFAEMWAAIPLLWMHPFLPIQDSRWLAHQWKPNDQYQFADLFLYHNRISADQMMQAGRFMQLLLSIFLGLLLMVCAFRLSGIWGLFLAGIFWAFSPAFLMQASLVSTDYAFCLFYFLFFVSLGWSSVWLRRVAMGVGLGLCVASKYFSATLFIALGAMIVWETFVSKRNSGWLQFVFTDLLWALPLAFLSLALVYQFHDFDVGWVGFKGIFLRSQAGRASFFLGHRYTEGKWLYFPVVFLMKTPIPVLVAGLLSTALLLRNKLFSSKIVPEPIKKDKGLKEKGLILNWGTSYFWIPPLVFFLIACLSKVQIGHRHIVGIYPFIILGICSGLSLLPRKWTWLLIVFMTGSVVTCVRAHPYYLSYFNEAVGGPSNGYRYLTDSNVDWGQGLSMLNSALSKEDLQRGIYLAYFGVADPHYYGIRYVDVGSDLITGHLDDSQNPAIQPTTLAISITHLQGTYYQDPDVFKWLNEYVPSKKVAHSLFIYDFSQHPEALAHLKLLSQHG